MRFASVSLMLMVFLLTALPAAFAEPGGAFPDAGQLNGTWKDESTNCLFTIMDTGNGPILTTILDDDGERFQLRTYEVLAGDRVSWSYYVPSTGYNVFYECMHRGEMMECIWSNDHGMLGTENLPKVD